jgi:hypothetical protein
MKTCHTTALCLAALLVAPTAVSAQSKRSGAAPTRYFQLTVNLKSGAVADQQSSTQTITTGVAIRSDRPGSCKARMMFQAPTGAGAGTKYVELGTKFDCNDVHIEGDGIALEFALETSRVVQMIKTKRSDGVEIDEPLIGERAVQLAVKLPLDQAKVVFDSSSKLSPPLKTQTLPEAAPPLSPTAIPIPPSQDSPILIELIATELK